MSKKRNHAQPNPTAELERLAAQQMAPPPAILDLNACRVRVADVHDSNGAQKLVEFIHLTGGFIARTTLPTSMAREVATMLNAPPGIVIPNNDEPAA